MKQSAPNRKRPAPGASPLAQQQVSSQQPSFPYSQMPDNPDFSTFDFGGSAFPTEDPYSDPSLTEINNNLTSSLNPPRPQTHGNNVASVPSTDLVRRPRDQHLAPHHAHQEQWNDTFDNGNGRAEEDEQELAWKVEKAKKDAQGRKKQIPPFVQKLSSFLDSAHTDLIRWSDDGRSFIVLDEDEFARTMIPELFKHNNYASFVRQLNMYGFHKTVNITDGSLRQSEKARKGVKPPSMYSHPYFRRARPELLWLIQKPTSKSTAKRKREEKDGFESEEERQYSPGPDGRPLGELGITSNAHDLAAMPRGELNAVRQEVQKLQQQQTLISRMIGQLKEQNDQFYRQATAFQALHDRHENSINAILTFLATFYNRSLDGHAAQNLVNMFSSASNQSNQQQHGSVVEEYNEGTPETNSQIQRYTKKPQLLLAGPNASSPQSAQPGMAVTEPNSARASASPAPGQLNSFKRSSTANTHPQSATSTTGGRATASPIIKDDAKTPDLLNTVPETDEMLSLINNVNATTGADDASTPAFEYSAALNNLQRANANGNVSGNGPLTLQQTNDMLALMANQQADNSSANNALALSGQTNNFSMDKLRDNQQRIESLNQLSHDNTRRLSGLQTRLGAFSPTGSIPGLGEGDVDPNYGQLGEPGQFDPDSLLNYPDYTGNEDLEFFDNPNNDFDWNYDPNATADSGADMFQVGEPDTTVDDRLAPQSAAGGGRVSIGSVSSEAKSPANVAVEDEDATMDPGTPHKRQRRS